MTVSSTDKEDETNQSDDEKAIIVEFSKEVESRLSEKAEIRNKNQNVQNSRPTEASFSKLDSSLKKNTTFVKKLKNFSASQLDSLMKDMQVLNLTKYISEVAAALVDAKLKMTDVGPAVKICCLLHQTYAEFSHHLFENWQKILSIKIGDKIQNPSKLRVDLRFYAELVNAGLFNNKTAFSLLGNILTCLINMDKEEHYNISIILSFCKHCGEDYAGLTPRKYRILAEKYEIELPRSSFLPPEKQQNVRTLLKDYYNSLSKHLLKDHFMIQEFERQNRRILQTKGELNQERKEKLDTMRVNYEKLFATTQNFSEILDEDMPELSVEFGGNAVENVDSGGGNVVGGGIYAIGSLGIGGGGGSVSDAANEIGAFSAENVWGDIDTRRFYCELPELNVFLPSSTSTTTITTITTTTTTTTTTTASTTSIAKEDDKQTEKSEQSEHVEDDDEDVFVSLDDDEPEAESSLQEQEEDTSEDVGATTISNKVVLDAFLNNLPNCINREMIDNAAIDFLVTLNTKHNRKKLVRTLFGVNRTRLDLLPFYGRFVAILYPALPEIANELCQMLRQDFKYHVRKKDQINIESKIKVVRYIGELVKFKLYSKLEALFCVKVLLHDFSHHHIEMACNLLEVCGRYLFCNPDTHHRTKIYLEQMMRKKAVMALDSRYVTQIENAYYYVNPPESIALPRKQRPIMHQFIRKLIYQDLQKNNTDKILRLLRKLDWNDEEIAAYTIKCLTNAHNVKYFNIRCLANLLAGLVAYQEEVGTRVVDGVLEDIRLGMEINLPKYYQRRVAQIKYLGELYNYRMVESADIFKVLYSLITFGVTMNYEFTSPLDPADNTFRIRLACVLLETSGTYFSSGSSKRRLDYYLIFFQAYYWFKRSDPIWQGNFPVSVNYLMRDTLTALRPKLALYENYEQAKEQLQNVRKTLGIVDLMGDETTIRPTSNCNLQQLDSIAETDTEIDEEISTITDDVLSSADTTENEDEDAISIHEDHEEDDDNNITATRRQQQQKQKQKQKQQDSDDDDDDNDNDNDDDDDDDNNDDDDDDDVDDINETITSKTKMNPNKPKHVSCTEDDEFVNALDRMVSDNIQERMRENVKPAQVDIAVPMTVRSNKKTYEQLQETIADEKQLDTMDFTLMIRKGNKQVYRNFKANVDSELAQNLRDQEMAQREEKQRVKRLTLNITERLEEEDYQEMLQQQQRPAQQNLNRERKKYQHPKGAPDADLIFGPKRVR